MSHLGERASELIDGRLSPAAAEKALAHVALCRPCRDQLDAERLMKQRLQHLSAPEPGADLIAGLLLLGGPEGPLAARPGHVPGTPRPQTVPVGGPRPASGPTAGRPPARPGERSRAGRLGRMRPRTRVATALAGALAVAGVAGGGTAALVAARGSQPPSVRPPVASFAAEHEATTVDLPFVSTATWAGGSGR